VLQIEGDEENEALEFHFLLLSLYETILFWD
jgi:hypothetical protein